MTSHEHNETFVRFAVPLHGSVFNLSAGGHAQAVAVRVSGFLCPPIPLWGLYTGRGVGNLHAEAKPHSFAPRQTAQVTIQND